ncbi:hypothetical protein DM02DRAFT_631490 [Periconia macrospinosa]|uniref:Uncharacterized protein n=1 Tax=Periconia macrospinosa TaxID=97972 RepID=A0A2V1DFW5_9PLEO|nr:hypothetical protein DM02DRAFT_631490 [Periconia macrospinosa]
MGYYLSIPGQFCYNLMGRFFSTPVEKRVQSYEMIPGSKPDMPVCRPLPKRNGECYYCSYASRAYRKMCNYCGPGGMGTTSKHLVVPVKKVTMRLGRSINVGRIYDSIMLSRSREQDGEFASSYNKGAEMGEREKNIRVEIFQGNRKSKTPDIVLTSADNSNPSMDTCTWNALDTETSVVRCVDMYSMERKLPKTKHGSECKCEICKETKVMNGRFKMAMGAYDDGLDGWISNRGTHGEMTQDREKSKEHNRESCNGIDDNGVRVATEGGSGQPSRVRVFSEDLSNPEDPALFFPLERTIIPKRGNSNLRETYLAQGGVFCSLEFTSSAQRK